MKMKRFLIPFLLTIACPVTYAQDNALPSLFVRPLDGDLSQIQGWQPALGEGLAEMLITEITKLNKFEVLESTALADLAKEIDLGTSGYVGKDEKVDKGGWKGADFMFVGKVTRFGANKTGVNLGGFVPGSLGNLGVRSDKYDVRIDWRLVDAYSRKVMNTGSAVGQQTGLGFDIGVSVYGHGGGIGFQNTEFMNSALGKATVKALNAIIAEVSTVTLPPSGRRMAKDKAAQQDKAQQDKAGEEVKAQMDAIRATPGKVLAVPAKGVVIVTLGNKQGLKAGDKLKLYETVDTKDDQGKVVFTEEKLVGEITLEAVQDDRSKASYTGNAEVKSGWVVKAN
jgi:curli biogenesis system outer membrane secretion channel CsgG